MYNFRYSIERKSHTTSSECNPFLHPNSGDKFLHSFSTPDEYLFELITSQKATVARNRPVFVMSKFGNMFNGNNDCDCISTIPKMIKKTITSRKPATMIVNRNNFDETEIRDEAFKLPTIFNTMKAKLKIEPSSSTQEISESSSKALHTTLPTIKTKQTPEQMAETMIIENEQQKCRKSLELQNNSNIQRQYFQTNAADISTTMVTTKTISNTTPKPYVCEMCDKAFSQYGYLVVHWRSHSGDRPYVCEICEKRFTQSGNLTVHKRTHFVKKKLPNICYKCNKTFLRVSNFAKHLSVHFKLDPPIS